jgi:hypothetical protein
MVGSPVSASVGMVNGKWWETSLPKRDGPSWPGTVQRRPARRISVDECVGQSLPGAVATSTTIRRQADL